MTIRTLYPHRFPARNYTCKEHFRVSKTKRVDDPTPRPFAVSETFSDPIFRYLTLSARDKTGGGRELISLFYYYYYYFVLNNASIVIPTLTSKPFGWNTPDKTGFNLSNLWISFPELTSNKTPSVNMSSSVGLYVALFFEYVFESLGDRVNMLTPVSTSYI